MGFGLLGVAVRDVAWMAAMTVWSMRSSHNGRPFWRQKSTYIFNFKLLSLATATFRRGVILEQVRYTT